MAEYLLQMETRLQAGQIALKSDFKAAQVVLKNALQAAQVQSEGRMQSHNHALASTFSTL